MGPPVDLHEPGVIDLDINLRGGDRDMAQELRTMKSARGFDRLPPSEAKLELTTPPPRKRKAGHQKKPQAREGVVNLDKARARHSRTRRPTKG